MIDKQAIDKKITKMHEENPDATAMRLIRSMYTVTSIIEVFGEESLSDEYKLSFASGMLKDLCALNVWKI